MDESSFPSAQEKEPELFCFSGIEVERKQYLFSLALVLKSSITFRNRVTVKSPPSASSVIILEESNTWRLQLF